MKTEDQHDEQSKRKYFEAVAKHHDAYRLSSRVEITLTGAL